ncbi:MAG: (Fe-S)-binding protein [Desulfobacterota bacterium]|nr:(Fe-S)-binding protein [Thermodesulfobacteriota bacterium]
MSPQLQFDEKRRKAIAQCSRCSFCRAVCPIFDLTKRPMTNASGKMILLKEIMEGKLPLTEAVAQAFLRCTTCMNCTVNCPSGVDPQEMVKAMRKDLVAAGFDNLFKAMGETVEKYGNIYGETERHDWGHKKGKAAYVLFLGCVGTFREEEGVEEVLRLLDLLKVDYTLIDEVCCSGVLEDVGYKIKEDLAKKNIEAIHKTEAKTLITTCPYCYRVFKDHPSYQGLAVDIQHITQFLKGFDFGVKTDKRVTYHDPCDLGRHAGIYEEPREIIRKIAPNFVEPRRTRENAMCCGAGGGFRGAFAKESVRIARNRLSQIIEDTGAEVLLTECPSCLHNFKNAKRQKQKIEIYNLTEFLAKLYREKEASSQTEATA